MSRVPRAIALTAALVLSCGACAMGNAKAHGPFRACGQSIANDPGFRVEKLDPGKPIEPIDTTRLILQLVPRCAHGADIAIAPPKIIRVLASIRATDGKPVAIDIEYPGDTDARLHGTLTVGQDHRVIAVVPVCACAPPSTTTGAPPP